MKQLFFFLLTVFISGSAFSQTGFKWEVTDTTSKSKAQLYSDTKAFIANHWKSAQHVIQNDDKEAGIIIIKGNSIQEFPLLFNNYTFVYNYTATFRFKDGKFRINIDDVYNDKAFAEKGTFKVEKVEPFDIDVQPKGGGNIPKKKKIEIMNALRSILQYTVNSYVASMKSESVTDDF